MEKLAEKYRPALEDAVRGLEKTEKPETHSDLGLAYDHLSKAQEEFEELPDDPSNEELEAALTELTEVAERVVEYVPDLHSDAELTSVLGELEGVVREARDGGLRSEKWDPQAGLDWHGDDVPDDGTGH